LSKVESPRQVLWILIALMLGYAVYLFKTGDTSSPPVEASISQATVVSDFREMKDIKVPIKPELGGQFYATELLFPDNFKGQVGDVFYARLEDGHILTTVSYRIEKLTSDVPPRAVYTPLKDYGPGYVPEGSYTRQTIGQFEMEQGDRL